MARPPPNLTLAPFTIRQSRWKAALLLAGSAALAAGCALMLGDPTERVKGGFATTFFVLCAVVFVAMLARPGELLISSDGLIQRSLLRTHRWDWRDVSNFRLWRIGRSRMDIVTFDDRTVQGVPSTVSRGVGAGSATLVGSWELPPADLAALLNEAKARWG